MSIGRINVPLPKNEPNGAGKTTLLSIGAFLLPPTSGTIYWEGMDADTMDKHQLRKKVTIIT